MCFKYDDNVEHKTTLHKKIRLIHLWEDNKIQIPRGSFNFIMLLTLIICIYG